MCDDLQAMRDEFIKLASMEGNEPIRCSRMHFSDWAETIDEHFTQLAAITAECDASRVRVAELEGLLDAADRGMDYGTAMTIDSLTAKLASVEKERDSLRAALAERDTEIDRLQRLNGGAT